MAQAAKFIQFMTMSAQGESTWAPDLVLVPSLTGYTVRPSVLTTPAAQSGFAAIQQIMTPAAPAAASTRRTSPPTVLDNSLLELARGSITPQALGSQAAAAVGQRTVPAAVTSRTDMVRPGALLHEPAPGRAVSPARRGAAPPRRAGSGARPDPRADLPGPDARPLRRLLRLRLRLPRPDEPENVDLSFSGATAAGWRNFQLVLTDPLFWKSIENNLLFAAVQIAVALTLGFFLGVSLSSGVRFRRFFYIAFLLPSLVPLPLFATVFGQMIQTNGGAINQALHDVGLGALAQDWTGQSDSGLRRGVHPADLPHRPADHVLHRGPDHGEHRRCSRRRRSTGPAAARCTG